MELDTVGRLVAYLDESALHLLRPVGEVDEFLAAGAGVGVQTDRSRMLIGVGRVERVERLCIDRVAGHVLAPVVECDAPRISAHVGAKCGEPMAARLEPKPAAVPLAHRAVRRLHLTVMKNSLAEN